MCIASVFAELQLAEDNLRNIICSATVVGQSIRPLDHSYFTVYHTPVIDSAKVKCIICMQKMTQARRPNFNLPFVNGGQFLNECILTNKG